MLVVGLAGCGTQEPQDIPTDNTPEPSPSMLTIPDDWSRFTVGFGPISFYAPEGLTEWEALEDDVENLGANYPTHFRREDFLPVDSFGGVRVWEWTGTSYDRAVSAEYEARNQPTSDMVSDWNPILISGRKAVIQTTVARAYMDDEEAMRYYIMWIEGENDNVYYQVEVAGPFPEEVHLLVLYSVSIG